jgi:hypothetical protein
VELIMKRAKRAVTGYRVGSFVFIWSISLSAQVFQFASPTIKATPQAVVSDEFKVNLHVNVNADAEFGNPQTTKQTTTSIVTETTRMIQPDAAATGSFSVAYTKARITSSEGPSPQVSPVEGHTYVVSGMGTAATIKHQDGSAISQDEGSFLTGTKGDLASLQALISDSNTETATVGQSITWDPNILARMFGPISANGLQATLTGVQSEGGILQGTFSVGLPQPESKFGTQPLVGQVTVTADGKAIHLLVSTAKSETQKLSVTSAKVTGSTEQEIDFERKITTQ